MDLQNHRRVATPPGQVLYVSPQGNDGFSGGLAEVNDAKTDGPLATVAAARNKVRALKASGRLPASVTVYLRGGRYELAEPLVFGPEDSAPVTYAGYPGEETVLDGGREITGWQPARVNDRDAWMVHLPEVQAGRWRFRELFVAGERAPRARLPKAGGMFRVGAIAQEYRLFQRKSGWVTNAFYCNPGDVQAWRNLQDVDIVVLHFWSDDRSPIARFDPATHLVELLRAPNHPLSEDTRNPLARYYVENVFEALTEPGEWYLDRRKGNLYYLPRPGEDPARTRIVAPRVAQLLVLAGQPDEQRYVEFLRFENLTFAHTDWHQIDYPGGRWGRPDLNLTGHSQASAHLGGAIQATGARHCAIENCRLEHLGWYAVALGDGCVGNRIVGNEMADLGGGGVKINGADAQGPAARRTGQNRVTDNHIHHGGRVFHAAMGILAMHTFGNALSHNHIHDFYQSGISCGWVWGYADSVARDNRIEKNHIHDLGFGMLSDMGGVYTLGVQPGTVIRGNLIHDITATRYGAWCIYPDEGSSHLLIEDNVCHTTNSHIFHHHIGRENTVRNNVFAFGAEGVVALGWGEEHRSFTIERNLLITDGQPIYRGGYRHKLEGRHFLADLNVIWDTAGAPTMGKNHRDDTRTFDADQWHALGQDLHSAVADPQFKDLAKRDFTLAADSPAPALGFRPIDLSDVGPRPAAKRD